MIERRKFLGTVAARAAALAMPAAAAPTPEPELGQVVVDESGTVWTVTSVSVCREPRFVNYGRRQVWVRRSPNRTSVVMTCTDLDKFWQRYRLVTR